MSFYAGSEGRCLRTQSDGRTPDTLHEECGVFGVYAPRQTDIAGLIYYGLYSLQHRGQESCGIVVNDDGVFVSHKDLGLVNEVFGKDVLRRLPTGRLGVGHVRYGTTGGTDRANCQPIEINHSKGRLALAHNGNISNAYDLRCALESRGAIFHTTSDTETIAYIVTQERLCTPSIQEAVSRAMYRLDGAYSMVLMSAAKLIAVRDPHGFRPLCYGIMPDGTYIVASESCALGAVGARFERDVLPGEILVFDENGVHSPGPIRSSTGYRFTPPASAPGRFWHGAIPPRRTSSSACRTPGWMRHWATRRNPASPTASDSSRTATSGAPSSRRGRISASILCASSSRR